MMVSSNALVVYEFLELLSGSLKLSCRTSGVLMFALVVHLTVDFLFPFARPFQTPWRYITSSSVSVAAWVSE
jgi:hypothetical protein